MLSFLNSKFTPQKTNIYPKSCSLLILLSKQLGTTNAPAKQEPASPYTYILYRIQHSNTLLFKGLSSSIPNCSQLPTSLIMLHSRHCTFLLQPISLSLFSICSLLQLQLFPELFLCGSRQEEAQQPRTITGFSSPGVNRSSWPNSPSAIFYLLGQWGYSVSFLLFPPFPFLHHFKAGLMPSLSTSPVQYHSTCFSLLS